MHRPVIFTLLVFGLLIARLFVHRRVGGLRLVFRGSGLNVDVLRKRCVVDGFLLFGIGHIRRHNWSEGIFLPARRRNARLLVLVVRVTRRAACLLHLILNHRHDGVVGDAALTRTIVVQNVTEPKPALLHELPRSRSFSGGIV